MWIFLKTKQKQLYCKGRDVLKRLWQIDIRKGWGNKKWCSNLKKKSSGRANRGPDYRYNRNPGCLDWKRDGGWDGNSVWQFLYSWALFTWKSYSPLRFVWKVICSPIFNGRILQCTNNNSYHILGVDKLPVSLPVCSSPFKDLMAFAFLPFFSL